MSSSPFSINLGRKRQGSNTKKRETFKKVKRFVICCACLIAFLWLYMVFQFFSSTNGSDIAINQKAITKNIRREGDTKLEAAGGGGVGPAVDVDTFVMCRSIMLLAKKDYLGRTKIEAINQGHGKGEVAKIREKVIFLKRKVARGRRSLFASGMVLVGDQFRSSKLNVWPAPQITHVVNASSGGSINRKRLRLDASHGLNVMFSFRETLKTNAHIEDSAIGTLVSSIVLPQSDLCEKYYSKEATSILSNLVISVVPRKSLISKLTSKYTKVGTVKRFFSTSSARSDNSEFPVYDRQREMYLLTFHEETALIQAASLEGVLHGVRTLSSLFSPPISSKSETCVALKHSCFEIFDFPRFAHRGFLIDTAHHYKTVDFLKRLLFGMGLMKMNVLHWHLTDHQSFGMKLPSEPTLATVGPKKEKAYYTLQEMKDVLQYGKLFGIRVLLELDIPGHALSWEQGYPVIVNVKCKNKRTAGRHFPNCDANLDPRVEQTYVVLRNIFKDLQSHLPNDATRLIHLGGDEVSFNTWKRNAQVKHWMAGEGASVMKRWNVAEREPSIRSIDGPALDTPHRLLELFERRLGIIIDKLLTPRGTVVIRWEEIFKPHLRACCYEPRNLTIVQMWRKPYNKKRGRTKEDILKAGFRGIIVASEEHWYFDPNSQNQFWQDWSRRYMYDPLTVSPVGEASYKLSPELHGRVYGGEAACWGRCMSSTGTFNKYVWTPLSAVSERLWSDEHVQDFDDARRRLQNFLNFLSRRWRRRGEKSWETNDLLGLMRFHERASDK